MKATIINCNGCGRDVWVSEKSILSNPNKLHFCKRCQTSLFEECIPEPIEPGAQIVPDHNPESIVAMSFLRDIGLVPWTDE